MPPQPTAHREILIMFDEGKTACAAPRVTKSPNGERLFPWQTSNMPARLRPRFAGFTDTLVGLSDNMRYGTFSILSFTTFPSLLSGACVGNV